MALRLLVDEDFDNDILRAVLRRSPTIDIVRVEDVELRGQRDPVVLHWAAENDRVVFTHDVTTMTKHAYDRVARGLRMPGLFAARQSLPVAAVIEDILLLDECSEPGEWEGQVRYLPL
jgi:hypothetical protein